MRKFVVNNRVDLQIDSGVDAASVTGAFIDYVKPSGADGFWVASPVASTTEVLYEIQDGELDEPGNWLFQAYVETADGNSHGLPVEILVEDVIRTIGHTH